MIQVALRHAVHGECCHAAPDLFLGHQLYRNLNFSDFGRIPGDLRR